MPELREVERVTITGIEIRRRVVRGKENLDVAENDDRCRYQLSLESTLMARQFNRLLGATHGITSSAFDPLCEFGGSENSQ